MYHGPARQELQDAYAVWHPTYEKTLVPHTPVDTKEAPSGKGKHTVRALNPQSGDHKRPDLVKGVAFAHRMRTANEPKNAADNMPSEFQVKTVKEFQWPEADYGKVCDYATAYENEGGKRGPWSDVVSVIIA